MSETDLKPDELRLDTFAKQAARFYIEDAPAKFTLCPLAGVVAECRIEPTTGSERIWDMVYINGRCCGNRHGGVRAFCWMTMQVAKKIPNMNGWQGWEEWSMPPLKPSTA